MELKYIQLNNHPGGLAKITAVVDADKAILGEMVTKAAEHPDQYELELKKKKTKRGLTANAYYWVLTSQLAKALQTSKDEMHRELVLRYGAFKTNADGKPVVFSLAAGEDPCSVTPYARSFAEGMVNGKRFIHYIVIKGSSECTAEEMNALIAGVVSEAKEQGIETLTPKELAELSYEIHD